MAWWGTVVASIAACVLGGSAAHAAAFTVDDAQPRKGGAAANVRELAAELEAPRPETRRAAVKKLAELGTRPAWELVVRALADVDGQVADEAEVLLARLTEAPLVLELYGRLGLRHKEPFVRTRVAEAFGRMTGPLDGAVLAKALDVREVETAHMLLWTIERALAEKRPLGDLARVTKEIEDVASSRCDAELRGRALIVLERLDHFRALPLVDDAVKERDPRLRCAALAAVSGFNEVQRFDRAVLALSDAEPSVRAAAIANLEAIASRPAIVALAHHLGIEKRERLVWRIVGFLRALSGEDHGLDAAAWVAWAGKIQGPLSTGTGGVRPRPLGDTRVQLAGLNLISDRVCFLVDFSGSTWDTKVGERSRKQILDAKLRAALEALPETTRFNVVPYTGEPLPWEKALVPATKTNVARALAAFERCHARGRGNYYDAVLCALQDPDVDSIVALTDGVPTGGQRWNLDLMVELLVERNRLRHVAFDSILVDAPRSRVAQWTSLATRTSGRCIEVKLE